MLYILIYIYIYSKPSIYWASIYRVFDLPCPILVLPYCKHYVILCVNYCKPRFDLPHAVRYTVHISFPPRCTVNRGYTVYILYNIHNISLILHISVHLTVIRFTMGLHSKIPTCNLNSEQDKE